MRCVREVRWEEGNCADFLGVGYLLFRPCCTDSRGLELVNQREKKDSPLLLQHFYRLILLLPYPALFVTQIRLSKVLPPVPPLNPLFLVWHPGPVSKRMPK